MSGADRARLVGINHVALSVGDLEAALEFYGEVFEFDLRGRSDRMAFVDMGDQFVALAEVGETDLGHDDRRHVGLVVDDPDAVERRLEALGVEPLPTPFFDFLDPWGNRIQVVAYRDVQFTKAEAVLRGMGLDDLEKSAAARAELDGKDLLDG